VLKLELGNERLEKQRLLDQILAPKVIEPEVTEAPVPLPIKPRHIPHAVRQQMLEEDDRAKAEVLKKFAERDADSKLRAAKLARTITPATTIEDLEKQLGVVAGE
jgi:hypothetical protein